MADKKISALTGAALPLAGTEVLPIVQSGSTVKVASNDLTTRNFRAAATTGILQVSGPTNGATRTMTVPDANFSAARTDAGQSFSGTNGFSDVTIFSGSGNPLQVGAPPASRCIATFSDGTYNARIAASPPEGYIFVGAGSNHPVGLVVNNNVSATFDTSGNTKLENGNLIIGTAGKGIDFSANGGDILSQYDEGTWNVNWNNLTGTPTSTVGRYTRIGRMVFFSYNTGAGAISGVGNNASFSLPFTPAYASVGTMIASNVTSAGNILIWTGSLAYPETFSGSEMVFSGMFYV
jgi:hypothetical protein